MKNILDNVKECKDYTEILEIYGKDITIIEASENIINKIYSIIPDFFQFIEIYKQKDYKYEEYVLVFDKECEFINYHDIVVFIKYLLISEIVDKSLENIDYFASRIASFNINNPNANEFYILGLTDPECSSKYRVSINEKLSKYFKESYSSIEDIYKDYCNLVTTDFEFKNIIITNIDSLVLGITDDKNFVDIYTKYDEDTEDIDFDKLLKILSSIGIDTDAMDISELLQDKDDDTLLN